jgi:hypothetical protein
MHQGGGLCVDQNVSPYFHEEVTVNQKAPPDPQVALQMVESRLRAETDEMDAHALRKFLDDGQMRSVFDAAFAQRPELAGAVCGLFRTRWLRTKNDEERDEIAHFAESFMHRFNYPQAQTNGLVALVALIAALGSKDHKVPLYIATFRSESTDEELRVAVARILLPLELNRDLVLWALDAFRRFDRGRWILEFVPIFMARLGPEFFERAVIEHLVLFGESEGKATLLHFKEIAGAGTSSIVQEFIERLRDGGNAVDTLSDFMKRPAWTQFDRLPSHAAATTRQT